uniref:Nucleotide-diphospho-sugar transferase domain-containing protein n=1 Tax=Opuntia streptacantha TaxID=393608 RepID=A0A7C9D3J7_OPUST
MRLTHRRPLPLPLSLCSSRSSAAMPRSLSPSSANNGVVSDSFASDMPETALVVRRSLALFVFLAALFFVYNSVISFRFLLYSSSSTPSFLLSSSSSLSVVFPTDDEISLRANEEYSLERVLKNAATEDKTVIITTLNEAWASPDSIIDLFLESFRLGQRTRRLLNHVVIVALDIKAFRRCLVLHPHCYALVTEGTDFSKEAYFMTPDYLKMMWRRIDFLRSVLEMGYNFVFTDADIMWFRDPFAHFSPDADFQIACDHFSGDPFDIDNRANGGFNYVKSNNRSIEFYKFWHSSQEKYPGYHDQDVFNFIKHNPYASEIGLKMRFLDTAYFGGFCEPSKDLNHVCTMHANCCYGMNSKLHDLKIMLQDWRLFMSLPPSLQQSQAYSWRVPKNCSLSSFHLVNTTQESTEQENAN